MTMKIKSKILQKTFSFWMPNNGGYVYLESTGNPGTLGKQICSGGGFTGNTLSAYCKSGFESTCRKWYRRYIRDIGDEWKAGYLNSKKP